MDINLLTKNHSTIKVTIQHSLQNSPRPPLKKRGSRLRKKIFNSRGFSPFLRLAFAFAQRKKKYGQGWGGFPTGTIQLQIKYIKSLAASLPSSSIDPIAKLPILLAAILWISISSTLISQVDTLPYQTLNILVADSLYIQQTLDTLPYDSLYLHQTLDSIIQTGVDSAAFPGVQLLVIHKGKPIYDRNFGYHTYDKVRPVQSKDLYDLASISKTTTATLALMYLYDQGLFNLDGLWKDYFPSFENSNKANLDFRKVLAHQAKLIPYITFWAKTKRKSGKFKWRTFKAKSSERFPIKITDQLYLHHNYKKKIYKGIKKSKLRTDANYKYSGLSFLLYPDLVQEKTGLPFDTFLYNTFYKPIGAERLVFTPKKYFPLSEIVPTEVDTFFRNQLVHGTVHDENAAMLNGISSNAGLFGNAHDLGKLLQLFLNKGTYAGKRYLKASTIEEFTRCQFCEEGNRRGLGFDKPLIDYDANAAYIAKSASPESYGHSGFTGTFYWVDPSEDLIVVFLSNRVYPTRASRKLYSMNIRPSLHEAVYEAIRRR